MVSITLLKRFAIVLFFILLIFGIMLDRIITSSMETSMINRSKQITAHFIAENVKHEFQPKELSSPKLGAEYRRFAGRIHHLTIGNDVERMKVWNTRMMVIWSDREELVGTEFADNEDLRRAIGGEIVSKLKVPNKTENIFESDFGRVLEMYVPVFRNGSVDTVFEVYLNLDALYQDINKQKEVIWIWTMAGLAVIYSLLSGIVGKASAQLELQTKEIKQSEKRFRDLIDAVKEGIISIDTAGNVVLFSKGAEQLFKYTAEEVIGKSPEMLIPHQYREVYGEGWNLYLRIRAARMAGKVGIFKGLRKDGSEFPLELTQFVSGTGHNKIGTVIIRDLSEQKTRTARS